MFLLKRNFINLTRKTIKINPKRTLIPDRKFELYIPDKFENIEIPKERLLPSLDPISFLKINNASERKEPRKIEHIRGPETIHNTFLHQQYGIIALSGCQLHHGHLNQIRLTVNKWITDNTFAIWRIPAPWKNVTKRGPGKKSGGGKGKISFYVTPIRAGRVILEVGGKVEFEEVKSFLNRVTKFLPCHAIAISQEELEEYKKEEEKKSLLNCNPLTRKRMIDLKLCNSDNILTYYDKTWYFEYEN